MGDTIAGWYPSATASVTTRGARSTGPLTSWVDRRSLAELGMIGVVSDDAGAPLIITAVLPDDVQRDLDERRRRFFPPDRRVVGAHLTLFHALPGDAEREVRAVLDEVAAVPAPPARLDEPFLLGRGVALRVRSPRLRDARAAIADHFHGRLTRQDGARWSPHVTVQNKVEPEEARRTLTVIGAEHSPRDFVVVGLALWRYRGGPWSAVTKVLFSERACP